MFHLLLQTDRPSGAKTIGVSFYPPLTQWATVVTPRWGVFVIPDKDVGIYHITVYGIFRNSAINNNGY